MLSTEMNMLSFGVKSFYYLLCGVGLNMLLRALTSTEDFRGQCANSYASAPLLFLRRMLLRIPQ